MKEKDKKDGRFDDDSVRAAIPFTSFRILSNFTVLSWVLLGTRLVFGHLPWGDRHLAVHAGSQHQAAVFDFSPDANLAIDRVDFRMFKDNLSSTPW